LGFQTGWSFTTHQAATLRYFTRELGDKFNLLMIIYSGLVILECHLVIAILANLLFLLWLHVPRKEKKKRKKEDI
jgi:hypothetical protein